MAIDFSGRWQHQGERWGKNIYSGRDTYRQRNETFRSKLVATLTQRLTVKLAGDYYHYNDDFGAFRLEIPNGFYDIDQDLDPEFHGHVWGTSLHLNYEFDFATFTSISAYRNLNQDSTGDFDFSTNFFQHTYFDSWGKSYSQEFNLSAPSLTLGARYTKDQQDFKGYNQLYPLSGNHAVIVTDKTRDDLDNDKWTYRVALDHNFTDDLMAYASFNTGFKSGYYSIVGSPAGSADPETVDAYEVGLKSQWLENRLQVNLAAYYYDFQDVQTLFLLSGAA